MKKIFKIVLFILLFGSFFTPLEAGFFDTENPTIQYCDNETCGLNEGITMTAGGINDLEKTRKFSQYAQDIIVYVLTFISIIGVVYIIFAGVTLMIGGGADDKPKKTKNMISYVIIGILIMWLAFPLMKFLINILNTSA